jgi:hypothetical protein
MLLAQNDFNCEASVKSNSKYCVPREQDQSGAEKRPQDPRILSSGRNRRKRSKA